MDKENIISTAIIGLLIVCVAGIYSPNSTVFGGLIHNVLESFDEGIAVDGTTVIDGDGGITLTKDPSASPDWDTAINSSISSTAAGTLGWFGYTSSVTSGDITGLRPVVTSNASGTVSVRGIWSQAKGAASAEVSVLQGILSEVSVSAGNVTSTYVGVLGAHFSSGAVFRATDLYVGHIRAQTRGDEVIATNDVLLGLENQAVGGNGREMDSALRIFDTSISGGIKGFTYGINLDDATVSTADIKLSGGATISSGTSPSENDTCTVKGSLHLGDDGTFWGCNAGLDWTLITITAND